MDFPLNPIKPAFSVKHLILVSVHCFLQTSLIMYTCTCLLWLSSSCERIKGSTLSEYLEGVKMIKNQREGYGTHMGNILISTSTGCLVWLFFFCGGGEGGRQGRGMWGGGGGGKTCNISFVEFSCAETFQAHWLCRSCMLSCTCTQTRVSHFISKQSHHKLMVK